MLTKHARYVLHSDPGTETGERIPTLDTDTLTVNQLWIELRSEIEERDDSLEYFSISPDTDYCRDGATGRGQPIGPYRWLACYAVTGGSEGHYVHVDRIWQPQHAREYRHQGIFLVKTFGGWDRACEIAAYLGARLGA